MVHDRALLAFKHPFAYAASRGIDDNAGLAAVPPATAAQAANKQLQRGNPRCPSTPRVLASGVFLRASRN
ncbi:MAG: hypothetical protein JWN96_90 [Mycobacterium sp.]|nr:hypothetical protein [Mycobacterium sp.]